MALWFSHIGIIAYPSLYTQSLFSTPNSPLYSDIALKNQYSTFKNKKESDFTISNTEWKYLLSKKIEINAKVLCIFSIMMNQSHTIVYLPQHIRNNSCINADESKLIIGSNACYMHVFDILPNDIIAVTLQHANGGSTIGRMDYSIAIIPLFL